MRKNTCALTRFVIGTTGVLAMAGWLAYGQVTTSTVSGTTRGSSGTIVAGTMAVAGFAHAMTFNASAGNSIKLTLRDDVTSSSIANPTPGQFLTLLLCQDAAGSRSMAWPTNLRLSGGNFTLTRYPNRCDALTMVYDGSIWYEIARATNQ
ncbi:MAG: hypothetical protein HYX73_00955 [Acidobacteria bacterium]|nr:hypothetical protein [Acidobacteriota bacterium]